jgi:hypothetical protein
MLPPKGRCKISSIEVAMRASIMHASLRAMRNAVSSTSPKAGDGGCDFRARRKLIFGPEAV